MEKRQRNLDAQEKKALKQVIKRMLANETSRAIFLEQVLKNEQVLEKVMQNPQARQRLVKSALDQGQERHAREMVMLVGEERCGSASGEVKRRIEIITDVERLDRMLRRAAKASSWEEILETA